jgi:hypothetical protein
MEHENYQEWVRRYGKPILEIDVIEPNREMTIEEELSDMPHKVAIFNNPKNQLGFTICAKYGQWHMNHGDKWAIKYFLDKLKEV